MTLEPFNPDARCPKCDYDAVHTAYVEPFWPEIRWADQFRPPLDDWTWTQYADIVMRRSPKYPDYLKRTCARCGFIWSEAVLEREATPGLST